MKDKTPLKLPKLGFEGRGAIFKISIADGYCEWSYLMEVSPQNSVRTVYERIRRAFKAKADDGEYRGQGIERK